MANVCYNGKRNFEIKEVFPLDAKVVVRKALENKLVVPAFNIPHLPMVKPIVQAVVDEDSVAMIQVARLEWEKFESESLERVAEEYGKYKKEGHTLLHLDHVPVIDEDHLEVGLSDSEIARHQGRLSVRDGGRLASDAGGQHRRHQVRLRHRPRRGHPRGGRVGRGHGPRDGAGRHPL